MFSRSGGGLGLVSPVTITAAASVGRGIATALGVDTTRFTSGSELYAMRRQMVDMALSRALNRDQGAVLQLWYWTGIPDPANGLKELPSREARDYAVAALQRYYRESGAAPLPGEWMTALSTRAELPGIPPVPETFDGDGVTIPGFTIPDFNVTAATAGSGLVWVGALAAVYFLASRRSGSRRRR